MAETTAAQSTASQSHATQSDILPSFFLDKSKQPKGVALSKALGKSAALWDELKARIAARFAPVEEEWTYAGQKRGWALRLKQKKRAILYMTPLKGNFRAVFALGDKAVAALQDGGVPDPVWQIIQSATRYPEGRAVRLHIRSRKDLAVAEKIAVAKMAN